MNCKSITNIGQISMQAWNQLVPKDSTFAKHQFLSALEQSGCVKPENGWLPHHLLCFDNDELVGAMPFYIKGHSYGEYVFDWAWVDAYHRHGYEYYPKGLCAIPFTPASCHKLLVKDGHNKNKIKEELIKFSLKIASELNLSSIHSLFLDDQENTFWLDNGFTKRVGYQFHWQNSHYTDFNHYLTAFSSSKRKKIRQQKKSINHSQINIKILHGDEISLQYWHDFYEFYINTVQSHGAMAYLNLDFFLLLAKSMPENMMMICAHHKDTHIACALFFKAGNTLFGRYWGCREHIPNLHFEICYYQAIEYCITEKITYFEAGAQGQHKLSRGFLPVETHSAHWLRHADFFTAIKDHLQSETNYIKNDIEILTHHSPFKSADG